MFDTYFLLANSINGVEEVNNSLYSIEEIFSCAESILSAIANLLVAFVGVYGIKYLNKIKEKNDNATFGYYARLKVRLHIMKNILDEYKMPFLDRLIPESERTDIEPSKIATVDLAIKELIENAKDTLCFLKDSEDQMPASRTWSDNYGTLLEFVEDCVKMDNIKYFKWNADFSDKQEAYYKKHKENIEMMIACISEQQERIQKKLYKIPLKTKLKLFFKRKDN